MMFIPEPDQKKTEKELNKLLNELQNDKMKMQVKAAGGIMPVVEWSVHGLQTIDKLPAGVIMITKSK
jgi:hypothetical protein